MTNYIVEDVNYIAQRLREIEKEKELARAKPEQEFGIELPETTEKNTPPMTNSHGYY
jgi:hypothetical protein